MQRLRTRRIGDRMCAMDTESKQKAGPHDLFLNLLNLLAFYASAISFITLWMQYINALYPDRLNFYHEGVLQSILWSSSILIVSFPVRLLTTWLLARGFAVHPEKREVKIRKWLVYLTLFLSSVAIIGDLITLVYNFLNGELTLPFFLKILIVLIVAGVVFAYFLYDLRQKRGIPTFRLKLIMAGAAIAVVGSVIGGFLIVGTPVTQRNRRFDERRVSDLGAVQNEVINYWTQKNKLPENIEGLRDPTRGFEPPYDPQTDRAYEYKILTPLSFELCAAFATEQNARDRSGTYAPPPMYFGKEPVNFSWAHGKGRFCFSRTIDPDFWRPQPPEKTPRSPL